MTYHLPSLDISTFEANKEAFAKELGENLERYGFIAFNNHHLPKERISNTLAVSRAFFDLPLETKMKYCFLNNQKGALGYFPFGVEHAKDNYASDLKEFWQVQKELANEDVGNMWPEELPEFQPTVLDLMTTFESFGDRVLAAIAIYLGQEEDFFREKTNEGMSVLRLLHYPPVENPDTESIRAASHEDISALTVLMSSGQPGLEILDKNGDWIPVSTDEGAVICNIGDSLQRMTNHVLPSTTHRVVNPAGEWGKTSRYSIPFFMHFNKDVIVKPMSSCVSEENPSRYPTDMTAKDVVLEREKEINIA